METPAQLRADMLKLIADYQRRVAAFVKATQAKYRKDGIRETYMTQAPQPGAMFFVLGASVQQPAGQKGNSLALAGMILGIASLVFCCLPVAIVGLIRGNPTGRQSGFCCFPVAIVGLILSIKGKKKATALGGSGQGMAAAGFVTSIIGIVLSYAVIIIALTYALFLQMSSDGC